MLAEKLVSFCQVEGDIMQILSMHTLQVITAHFTFITAQIGNDCTIKFGVTLRGCETIKGVPKNFEQFQTFIFSKKNRYLRNFSIFSGKYC